MKISRMVAILAASATLLLAQSFAYSDEAAVSGKSSAGEQSAHPTNCVNAKGAILHSTDPGYAECLQNRQEAGKVNGSLKNGGNSSVQKPEPSPYKQGRARAGTSASGGYDCPTKPSG